MRADEQQPEAVDGHALAADGEHAHDVDDDSDDEPNPWLDGRFAR